jgi:membrane-bound lytic murein transglycosylase D
MMNTYFDALKLGRLGESGPDMQTARAFMDSVNTGLAQIRPEIEPRKIVADAGTDDESYAYTYKTVTQKVRKSHTVRKGESLGKIADKYNVGLSELKKWNKLKSTVIRPGQKLYVYSTVKKRIPVKLVVDLEESIADLQNATDSSDSCETTFSSEHTNVATKKETVPQHIADTAAKHNPSASVSATVQKRTADSSRYIYYTVQPGDTLWNIAQRYQSNIDQLKKLNNISRKNYLRSGIRIKIPLKGS